MTLPYLPKDREILYVSEEHPFLQAAKETAITQSQDPAHPTGAVLVKGDEIIGRGANGNDHHEKNGCERKRQNIPTGEGYDLCMGCAPTSHAEQSAICDAKAQGHDTNGADCYLYGHWWACESCWNAMIAAGIRNVYLCESVAID